MANSQLLSAVLRYDITVQFNIVKIYCPELGQPSVRVDSICLLIEFLCSFAIQFTVLAYFYLNEVSQWKLM